MLTIEKLNKIKSGEVFAHGTVENSPEGVYMTDSYIGRTLLWAAKKGSGYNDWAIYIHWEDFTVDWKNLGIEYVVSHGDKVISENNIKKLVPCDDESFSKYRL